MTDQFHIGQRVVCVRPTTTKLIFIRDHIYTIGAITPCKCEIVWLGMRETPGGTSIGTCTCGVKHKVPSMLIATQSYRFRSAQENTASMILALDELKRADRKEVQYQLT